MILIRAIIPAAGRSRRMGAAKQLLDYRGRPMLAAVLAPLLQSCVAGVMLVTHQGLEQALCEIITDAAKPDLPSIHLAFNQDAASGMVDSVRIGLRAWAARETIGADDGFLIVPSDQPGIPSQAVAQCCAAFAAAPDRIALATHAGRRGHPMIFPAKLTDFVQSPACDLGLNALVRAHEPMLNAVEFDSPAILRNVNTPDDYARLPE